MNWFSETFGFELQSTTSKSQTMTEGNIRVSILTDCLIRVENQPDGIFCDLPTQSVWYRDFERPKFTVTNENNNLIIKTATTEFIVSTVNGKVRSIRLSDGRVVTDYRSGNLKGTRRTLDHSLGKVKIGDGIISRHGVATLNDSKTLIVCPDGYIKPRKQVLGRRKNGTDIYYFAYGNNYKEALSDFFKLTGSTPLIPRFALGNWWSRYKAYSQDEYIALMERFEREEIPITVATVDMDWHWVNVIKKFGKEAKNRILKNSFLQRMFDKFVSQGWTGYSWNTELFPDYKSFLRKLKEMGLKVTLNLHPAVGVRFFEDMYDKFADFMGVDKSKHEQIRFDLADGKFMEGYFKFIHNKYEDDGVSFWWLDWQQGKRSSIEGLDPLWALNHYHYIESGRNGKRPLILSRFAEAGSHRYPLGFSGDTAIKWSVLNFQPYFTATAANIGYCWWSHDIGGHYLGRKNNELYVRWIQLGVFSPIMRLHSTNNEFTGKEPWKHNKEAQKIASDALRFRHRLIPYLYTMNRRTSVEGRALVEPMYYNYPEHDEAYKVGNQFFFGSELIVAPITQKEDLLTNVSGVNVWLPEGRYTDIFTGGIYDGGRFIKMFRDKESIPVLAKEGSIIPLDMNDRINDIKNPENLELLIYRGNGKFSLYEDDSETESYKDGAYATTDFTVSEDDGTIRFNISKALGDISVVPEKRRYTLSFRDITDARKISVTVNDQIIDAKPDMDDGFIKMNIECSPTDEVFVKLTNVTVLKNRERRELLIELISKYQINNLIKKFRFRKIINGNYSGLKWVLKRFREPIREVLNMSDSTSDITKENELLEPKKENDEQKVTKY